MICINQQTVKEKEDSQKRRKYDAEFKKEVLIMVYHGRPIREISQSLSVSENLIYRWKSRSASAGSSINQIDSATGTVSYAEHEKLKAQLNTPNRNEIF